MKVEFQLFKWRITIKYKEREPWKCFFTVPDGKGGYRITDKVPIANPPKYKITSVYSEYQ